MARTKQSARKQTGGKAPRALVVRKAAKKAAAAAAAAAARPQRRPNAVQRYVLEHPHRPLGRPSEAELSAWFASVPDFGL